jgi:hypothetical protein
MVGTKLYKNNKDDMAQYTATAQWCNANDAHIEDKGLYYEVCENVVPEPTTDEKLAALDAQYNADKSNLLTAYQTALVYDNTELMEQLKTDLTALDDKYDEDYESIVGEE